MADTVLLQVIDLVKHYGDVRAVDGISFEVDTASVFTLLGPNGAGKTTTLEILEGIRHPDSGEIVVFGDRMNRIGRAVKQRIGVLLQDGGFEPYLKVREILRLFASFFDHPLPVDTILSLVALEDKAGALVRTLSGGQKQRLAVGTALINDPALIFLDEPTTGLDPQARRNMWSIVTDLKETGKTIVLTTHYMEEAEALSDFVCIMDHGTTIAQGTPEQLTQAFGEETMIEFRGDELSEDAIEPLRAWSDGVRVDGATITLSISNLPAAMESLLAWSRERAVPLDDLTVRQPNLEDVFLSLTGRRLRE